MDQENKNEARYPIGTLVYYGPDNQTVTKISAGVVLSESAEPILKHWYGDQVTTDLAVISALGKFFQSYGVQKVVMTGGVAGCPHEEGIDYPLGEDCPECPFWKSIEN